MRHSRDPSGHLCIDDNPDNAERDCPRQRHPEACTRHGCGDDVSDIEKAADCGQDPQGDTEKLLHFCASTKRFSSRDDLASGRACRATSSRSALRAAMRAVLSAFVARTNSASRRSRNRSDLLFGGWTLSNVLCALIASSSASPSNTDKNEGKTSSRFAARAPNRAVSTEERAVSAVSFALCL